MVVRPAEYGELCGRNFKQDENGYWCVEVEKGKGGKYQLQRIPAGKLEFIRLYFDGLKPDDYIFKKSELVNKIDLHAKRATIAKEHYNRYIQMFEADKGARKRVYREILDRWRIYNKAKPPTWEEVNRPYFCHGKNKLKALSNRSDFKLDRLALLAVSVFHLSHWRTDDTVTSYAL